MSDVVFSGPYIDRHAALRADLPALEAARADPTTRFVVIWRTRCLVHETRIALLAAADLRADAHPVERSIFLGKRNDHSVFAVAIEARDEPDFGVDAKFAGLRDISVRLDAADAGLAAFARAMVAWQDNHRHCGVCGTRNHADEGGFVMACTSEGCGHRSFPRLDPAVIVLVYREECALLGRQKSWPEQRFSTIAGFVEPGESLEDAIRREVAEETDIKVGDTTYIASQPWPFPAALMIGFHARGTSSDITLNDGELTEARWVSRENIVAGDIVLPPKFSVACHLIESWFDRYDGPTLASFDLPARPFRSPRPVDENE